MSTATDEEEEFNSLFPTGRVTNDLGSPAPGLFPDQSLSLPAEEEPSSYNADYPDTTPLTGASDDIAAPPLPIGDGSNNVADDTLTKRKGLVRPIPPAKGIITKRRRLKRDPEVEKEAKYREELKAWARLVVQRALFDEFGADRQLPLSCSSSVPIRATDVNNNSSLGNSNNDDDDIYLEFIPGSSLRNELLEDLLSLTRENMKQLYDGSGSRAWAWSDSRKRGELRSERMRWIVIRSRGAEEGMSTPESQERGIIGFIAFRFSAELGIPHTYLHELQVFSKHQGKGYGSRLLRELHFASEQVGMQLVMLTVFSANQSAVKFYKKFGYDLDEASPGPCFNLLDDNCHKSPYEIMSKVLNADVLVHGCELCSFRCRFQDTLIQHAGFAHNKPWPHPCSVPGCHGGTVHIYQLQRHTEIKHAKPHTTSSSSSLSSGDDGPPALNSEPEGLLNARITFKIDGRKGTVIKCGEKGFYTVRVDGATLETIVCRASSFLGFTSQPTKKKQYNEQYDADHALALKLQYEDGWARRSSRLNKSTL